VLWIRKIFFVFRSIKSFFYQIRIRLRMLIRILLRRRPIFLHENFLKRGSQNLIAFIGTGMYRYSGTCKTKKSFAVEKTPYNMFTFKCKTSDFSELFLFYSIQYSIWIRIRTFSGFEFRSGQNIRVLSDSDPQHCWLLLIDSIQFTSSETGKQVPVPYRYWIKKRGIWLPVSTFESSLCNGQ
jgi:hypothetical protein